MLVFWFLLKRLCRNLLELRAVMILLGSLKDVILTLSYCGLRTPVKFFCCPLKARSSIHSWDSQLALMERWILLDDRAILILPGSLKDLRSTRCPTAGWESRRCSYCWSLVSDDLISLEFVSRWRFFVMTTANFFLEFSLLLLSLSGRFRWLPSMLFPFRQCWRGEINLFRCLDVPNFF